MSTKSDPSAQPHVHHQPGSVPTQSTGTAAAVSPEDYNNPVIADHLTTHLPAGVRYVGDMPEAATEDQPQQPAPVLTEAQAAKQAGDAVCDGLSTKPETTWTAVERAAWLAFLKEGMDPRAVKIALPFNSPKVLPGGVTMILGLQTDKKAACTEIDLLALGQEVAEAIRFSRARLSLERPYLAAVANESIALNKIATRLDNGLTIGDSVIRADGQLSYLLQAVLDIRGQPASDAVATKAQKARDEQAIRADEQARIATQTRRRRARPRPPRRASRSWRSPSRSRRSAGPDCTGPPRYSPPLRPARSAA